MSVLAVLLVVALLAWLQGLLYRKQWSRHLNLNLTFSERYATEGDTLTLTEVIINRKLLPLPWLAVKFQVSKHLRFLDKDNSAISDDYYRNDLFNPFLYQKITRNLSFVCGKRGYYTVKSAELVSGDILAREKLTLSVPFNAVLTVYPRTLDIDAYLTTHRQFLGQLLTKRYIQPDPFEFKGIREYQPYDSLRSVNFKATAKAGDLMVNMCDYTVSQEIVLLLNLQKYSAFPHESLYEDAIRLAASLAAYYVGNAVPLSFVTNDTFTWLDSGSGANHLASINDVLARIDLHKDVAMPGKVMLDEVVRKQDAKRRAGREPAYILLSTYHEKDLQAAYATLSDTGADVLWIIPVLRGMDITMPLSEHIVRADM